MSILRRDLLLSASVVAAGAATRRSPNILLLFPDQLRFDWTGRSAPRIPVRTPNIDALRRRGTSFTRAIVASPLCAPSRACLASGCEYDRCGVVDNKGNFPVDRQTYYRLLRDTAGYHVAGCGKLDLHKATEDWGLDGKRLLPEWGFSDGIDNEGKRDAVRSGAVTPKGPYMAYLHREGLAAKHVADFRSRKKYNDTFPTPLPDPAYCDNWIGQNGLDLLKRAPAGKPWHLAVNFTGPHEPMDITASMERGVRGRSTREPFPQPFGNTEFGPEIHQTIAENYTAMVENVDRWVGLYIDELRRRGELDNTIVVFSSDHGEMLGQHNRWGKHVPYQASVGVPLIAAGPGIKANAESDALVSIMDLASTFLDYGGIARPAGMDSRSLRPLLEGRTRKHREVLYSGLQKWRMVWDGRYKYIEGFDGEAPLLFDLDADPNEAKNLATIDAARAKRMQNALLHR